MDRKIKSFVLRTGRITAGQQKAIDELGSSYCIKPESKSDFIGYFSSRAPLYLEVGFGMGDATWQIALANPDRNYLGIEVFTPGIGKLLSATGEHGIDNLRIIQGDAVEALEKYALDSIFSGIHIFFPDPWPKKRHHKRRLLQPDFISLCTAKLVTGGYLYVVSDWQDYAEQALAFLEQDKFLKNRYEGFAEAQTWRPETKFEHKGIDKHHSIYEMYFIKS